MLLEMVELQPMRNEVLEEHHLELVVKCSCVRDGGEDFRDIFRAGRIHVFNAQDPQTSCVHL